MSKLDGEIISLQAEHFHRTQENFKPFINKKEGAIGTTAFIDKLKLKKGANIIMIHNCSVSDCLTNGQLGIFVDTVKSRDGKVNMLILKMKNARAGAENMRKNRKVLIKYPDCIAVERVKVDHSIRKAGGDVSSTALSLIHI